MHFSSNIQFPGGEDELICQIKGGKKDLFVYLANAYRDKIASLAASFALHKAERDDLMQEGYIALYSAVFSYDSSRGASFSTFSLHCVRNRMINWVEKNINSLSQTLPLSCFDETGFSENVASEGSFEDAVIAKSELSDLLMLAQSLLSELEKRVFALYIKGHSSDEICVSLGITKKSCDNALFRIRSKLKTATEKGSNMSGT